MILSHSDATDSAVLLTTGRLGRHRDASPVHEAIAARSYDRAHHLGQNEPVHGGCSAPGSDSQLRWTTPFDFPVPEVPW